MHKNIVRVLLGAMVFVAAILLITMIPDSSRALAPDDPPKAATPPSDGKLRIICFGAHPDDCEIKIGGTAALWTAQGHR